MDRRGTVRLYLVLGTWSLVTCAVFYLRQLQKPNVLRWRNSPGNDNNNARERTNIFFLKTHKCASTTVQNILMRFGYSRNLHFALPRTGNYLGYSSYEFDRAATMWPTNKTVNIFAHHTRYNYQRIKSIMEEDAAFVTILREPSYVFEAIYYFYDFAQPMKMTLQELLRSPKDWAKAKQNRARLIYGTNQMSWDLGFDATSPNVNNETDHSTVRGFIGKIDSEFDLVMIKEHMEASLVLLCDLMNWPLEHVVHLRLNARRADRVTNLDPGERHMVLKMNSIDEQLYEYFLGKFRVLVRNYGAEKMTRQVDKLLNLNTDMERNCMFSVNNTGFKKTNSYVARNTRDTLCYYISLNELEFTEIIREDQFRRASVLRELDALMTGGLV